MNLVNMEYGISLELSENQVNVLIVENPLMYRNLIEELVHQTEGGPGNFVLSIDNEPISMSKYMDLIVDPFRIDLNSKKIQNRIYELVREIIDNELLEKLGELNTSICGFLEEALFNIPIAAGYSLELDSVGLLKLYRVGVDNENYEFVDKIIEYIRIQSSLMAVNTLVFVNMNSFLTTDEMERIYEFAFYNKTNLVMIENQKGGRLNSEEVTLIDKDMCVVKY